MQALFIRSEKEARFVTTFWFEPERPLRYQAGQFTELSLRDEDAVSKDSRRWFTLSSSPTDKLISITTKTGPAPLGPFKRHLSGLTPGASVGIAEPMGDFVLPRNKDQPLIFVAFGIGITPFHSMVKWLHATDQNRSITLYYAANHIKDAAFVHFFEAAGIELKLILKDSPLDAGNTFTRIGADSIYSTPGARDKALIYLSGPEHTVADLYAGLRSLGIPPHRLVTDHFSGYEATNM